MADRIITYSLTSQFPNGSFNSTIRYELAQPVFDYFSRTKAVTFRPARPREVVNLRLIQSNSNRDAFAWAGIGGPIYFSPIKNYLKSATVFAKVLLHETGHVFGSLNHRREAHPLMAANAGTANTITALDYPYFARFPWRSSARPVLNDIRDIFGAMSDEEVAFELAAVREFIEAGHTCGTEYDAEPPKHFWGRLKRIIDRILPP